LGLQYQATRLYKLPLYKIVFGRKIFFLSLSLQKRKEKSNGGFTLYAVPFQESLIFFSPLLKKINFLQPRKEKLFRQTTN